MNSPRPVPPLPRPPQPAQAAQALAEAAQATAAAWAHPLDLERHGRAVSQLYSTLRDLGIAARGLAAWQPAVDPPCPSTAGFSRHVTAAADRLLSAWNTLDVPAAEDSGRLPDPDDPGAALCHAARGTIPAWRQPAGTKVERDAAIQEFTVATRFLSVAALDLATCAPNRRAISLQAISADLSEVTAKLTASIQEQGAAE